MTHSTQSTDTLTSRLKTQLNTTQTPSESIMHPSFSSWSDIPVKFQIFALIACIITFYIGVYSNLILSIFIAIFSFIIGLFLWFSATDLSVEITVFLAKFFPPSAQCYYDCIKTPQCEWSKQFRQHHQLIYSEYLEFEQKYNYCPQMDDVYPNGSITNWDKKWPTVNLRVYGLDTQIAKYFPKTMKLVNESDIWLSHVMFSILKPSKFIPRHRGPYRGVFRYHLSLEIPKHTNYEKELYLAVWPRTSSSEFWSPEKVPTNDPLLIPWAIGDDFLFDDTCVHEVINFTKQRRIILFMDVERHDISLFAKCIHRIFMGIAKWLPAVRNCKAVQDEYLKKCLDKNTNELKRFDTGMNGSFESFIDYENFEENEWIWFNRAPEILPYRQARIVIEREKNKNKK